MIKLIEELTTSKKWLRLCSMRRITGTWNLKEDFSKSQGVSTVSTVSFSLFVVQAKGVVFIGAVTGMGNLISLDDKAEGVTEKKSQNDSDENSSWFFAPFLKMLQLSWSTWVDERGWGRCVTLSSTGRGVDQGYFFLFVNCFMPFNMVFQPFTKTPFSVQNCHQVNQSWKIPAGFPLATVEVSGGSYWSLVSSLGWKRRGSLIISCACGRIISKGRCCGGIGCSGPRSIIFSTCFWKSIGFIQRIC